MEKVRIISGAPEAVQDQLNAMYEAYSPIVWNIGATAEGVKVTVVLLHESEIRKQQLAAARNQMAIVGGGLRPS